MVCLWQSRKRVACGRRGRRQRASDYTIRQANKPYSRFSSRRTDRLRRTRRTTVGDFFGFSRADSYWAFTGSFAVQRATIAATIMFYWRLTCENTSPGVAKPTFSKFFHRMPTKPYWKSCYVVSLNVAVNEIWLCGNFKVSEFPKREIFPFISRTEMRRNVSFPSRKW